LDVFRGATIAGMILVNNAGDWSKTYAPLLHAPWHGWTATDLVFPFFLFIVGVAIPFALGDRRGDRAVERKIHRRAAILFLLGLVLIWFPFYTVAWERARILGVLQRIAIVYLIAAFAYLRLSARARWIAAAILLAGYWAAMKLVPVPGFPTGDLSPEGNLAFHVDHLILGSHIWRYSPGPGDPEGILSTIPAIVSALAGLFVGDWLRCARSTAERLRGLLAAGAIASAAGLVLHRFFPINKNLWSPSYVVFTTGAALLGLGLCYYLIDVRRSVLWARLARPFFIFGTNSILAYAGSSLLARLLMVVKWTGEDGKSISLQKWLYEHLCVPHMPDYAASLAWALTHVAVWLTILTWLYRKKIFLRV
jgi:predicted acyltransferase